MLESKFQASVIKDLKKTFEGCIVIKNDPNYLQGIPDLLVLHNGRWAALECKQNEEAKHQPNQEYYVEKMNKMSYASFISPENKKEVFDELSKALQS